MFRRIFILTLLSTCSVLSLDNKVNIKWWAIQLKQVGNQDQSTSATYLDQLAMDIAKQHALEYYGRIGEMVGYYLFYLHSDSPSAYSPSQINHKLNDHPMIQWHQLQEPLYRHKRQHKKSTTFPDPLYADQWHLVRVYT